MPIAHRGGSALWPQNTMAAFEGAVGLGYRFLETDVQATSDGVLAVFHDDELAPTSNSDGRISEMTWSEVSAARVGGEPIPRLEELLDAFDDARISIDPKTDTAVEPLIEALKRPGVLDRVCIGSFSDARLERVSEAFGDAACLSFSPREIARLRVTSVAGRPGGAASPGEARCDGPPQPSVSGAHCVDPAAARTDPARNPPFRPAAHRAGLAVHVWTIDDPVEMGRLFDIGVDGIMTDEPAVLLEVMTERGLWPAPGHQTDDMR